MESFLPYLDEWKIDAENEKAIDFFLTQESEVPVYEGKRNIIIGRRGCGKSAIIRYIDSKFNSINELFHFPSSSYFEIYKSSISSDIYKEYWEYYILMLVVEFLWKKRKYFDVDTQEKFSKFFDHEKNAVRNMRNGAFSERKFSFSYRGLLLSSEPFTNSDKKNFEVPISSSIKGLREILSRIEYREKIFVTFDNIDADNNNFKRDRNLYFEVVSGLIRASIEIGRISDNLCSIVFITDDMYDLVRHNDKHKWADVYHILKWTDENIQKVISHKLELVGAGRKSSFLEQWGNIFSSDRLRDGSGKIIGYKSITDYSQRRPRDYVLYLQLAARNARRKYRNKLSIDIINGTLPEYSTRSKDLARIELDTLNGNADALLHCLTKLQKPLFRSIELRHRISMDLKLSGDDPMIDELIKDMIKCGILGNSLRNSSKFIYDDAGVSGVILDNLDVHRSLRKSLLLES